MGGLLLAGASTGPLVVVFEGLVTYALHSTLLIAVVWLLSRLTPRAHHLHDGLWKIALAGGVLTAGVQMAWNIEPLGGSLSLARSVASGAVHSRDAGVPAGNVPHAAAARQAGARSLEASFGDAPLHEIALGARRVSSARREVRTIRSDPPAGAFQVDGDRTGVLEGNAPILAATAGPLERSPSGALSSLGGWVTLITALWVGGAVLLLFHRGRQRLLLRRVLRRRRTVDHEPTRRTFERLLAGAGVRRSVRLSAASRLSSPVVLPGREICLPERALRELGECEREAMLAHELGHIVRADPMWLGLCGLLESVFYFQPANRVARRCWQRVSELLCDAWAVRHTGRGMTLARCLAQVASWMEPGGRTSRATRLSRDLAPGMAAKDSDLVRRVRRLLKEEETMKRNRSGGLALLSCVALLGLVIWSAPRVLASPQVKRAVTDEAPPAPAAPVPALPAPRTPPHAAAPAAAPAPPSDSVAPAAIPLMTAIPLMAPAAPSSLAGPRRLGITPGEISQALATHLGIDRGAAVLVQQVEKGSAADRAGIETFDVIIRVNGKGGVTAEKLVGAIQSVKPAGTLELTVVRTGKPVEITVRFDDEMAGDAGIGGAGERDDEAFGVARFRRPPSGRTSGGRSGYVTRSRTRYRTGIGAGEDESEESQEEASIDLERLQERLGRFQERLEGLGERLEERLGRGTEMRADRLEESLERWAERLEGNLEKHGDQLEKRIEERAHRIERLFEESEDTNEALEKLGPEVKALLEELGPMIHGLTDELSPALQELTEELGPEIGELVEEIGPEIGAFSDELGPLVEELTKELGPAASGYVRALTRMPWRSLNGSEGEGEGGTTRYGGVYQNALEQALRAAKDAMKADSGAGSTRAAQEAYKKALEQYGRARSGLDVEAMSRQIEAAQKQYQSAMDEYRKAMLMLEKLNKDEHGEHGTDSGRKKPKGRIL